MLRSFFNKSFYFSALVHVILLGGILVFFPSYTQWVPREGIIIHLAQPQPLSQSDVPSPRTPSTVDQIDWQVIPSPSPIHLKAPPLEELPPPPISPISPSVTPPSIEWLDDTHDEDVTLYQSSSSLFEEAVSQSLQEILTAPPSIMEVSNRSWLKKIYALLNYPQQARREGWEGCVILEFTLSPQGNLLSHKIIQSSGFSLLDQQALLALKRSQPFPEVQEGMTYHLPIHFKLKK